MDLCQRAVDIYPHVRPEHRRQSSWQLSEKLSRYYVSSFQIGFRSRTCLTDFDVSDVSDSDVLTDI